MSSFGQLTHWALAVRDNPAATGTRVTLARAVTPAFQTAALHQPSIAARLTFVPAERRAAAVSALAVIAGNRHLRHDPTIPLGKALAGVQGSAHLHALNAAVGLPQHSAARILGATVERTTALNLTEFIALLTDWDTLSLRARSLFLVDLHAAGRA